MNSEEQLKKQLDELLETKEFAFDETQWTKMSAVLDASDRKRRAIIIFFTLGFILLTGTLLLFYNFTNDSNLAQNQNAAKKLNTAAPAQNVASTNEQVDVSTPLSSQTNSEKNVVKHASAPSAPEVKPESIDIPANAPDATIVQSTETKIKNDPQKTSPLPITATTEENNNINSIKVKPIVANGTLPQNEKTEKNTVNSKNNFSNSENTKSLSGNDVNDQSKEVPINKTEKEQSDIKIQAPATALPLPQQQAPAQSVSQSEPEQKKNTAEIEKPISPAETKNEMVTAPVVVNTVVAAAAPDSIAKIKSLIPDTDYVKHKGLDLFAEAGANLAFGWKDNNRRDAFGLNPTLGLNCNFKTTVDLEVSVGIHYNMLGNLKYSHYTATVSRLDLGLNTKVTTFTPQRLHYVSVPVRVYRNIKSGMAYGFGLTASYLLTADSKVSEYSSNLSGESGTTTHKDKGYTQGYNDFDLQFSFLFRKKLGNRFYSQAELLYGLRDIKTGAYLPSSGFERNTALKLTLQYNLLTK